MGREDEELDVEQKEILATDGNAKIIQAVAFGSLVIFTSSTSILIGYSKNEGSTDYDYSPTATLLIAEILKFSISFILAYRNGLINHNFFVDNLDKHLWKFSLPAICYQLQNNLIFYALLYTTVPTYSILCNLKIIVSGILFYFVLDKKLTSLQWTALVLLTLGCMTSQLSMKEGETFALSRIGFSFVMAIVMLSSFAGIINEFLMKKVPGTQSIHLQNMKLYFFGILVNAVAWVSSEEGWKFSFTSSLRITTILIILSVTISGLAVSAVIKYTNAIVKSFAASLSIVLTSLISIYLFDFRPTILLFDGIAIIVCALFIFNYESR